MLNLRSSSVVVSYSKFIYIHIHNGQRNIQRKIFLRQQNAHQIFTLLCMTEIAWLRLNTSRCSYIQQHDLVAHYSCTEDRNACFVVCICEQEKDHLSVCTCTVYCGWCICHSGSFRGSMLVEACGSNICSLLEGDVRKNLLSPAHSSFLI